MSVGNRYAEVLARGSIISGGEFVRVPLDVSQLCDFTVQQVQETAGGTGVNRVYGSALPFGDPRLATLGASNPFWEIDTTLTWAAPGTIGARSARASDNCWSTILVEVEATTTLNGMSIYFFGKERG